MNSAIDIGHRAARCVQAAVNPHPKLQQLQTSQSTGSVKVTLAIVGGFSESAFRSFSIGATRALDWGMKHNFSVTSWRVAPPKSTQPAVIIEITIYPKLPRISTPPASGSPHFSFRRLVVTSDPRLN